jgi:hypothetical protein
MYRSNIDTWPLFNTLENWLNILKFLIFKVLDFALIVFLIWYLTRDFLSTMFKCFRLFHQSILQDDVDNSILL